MMLLKCITYLKLNNKFILKSFFLKLIICYVTYLITFILLFFFEDILILGHELYNLLILCIYIPLYLLFINIFIVFGVNIFFRNQQIINFITLSLEFLTLLYCHYFKIGLKLPISFIFIYLTIRGLCVKILNIIISK